jgi:hypothetical protein
MLMGKEFWRPLVIASTASRGESVTISRSRSLWSMVFSAAKRPFGLTYRPRLKRHDQAIGHEIERWFFGATGPG